MRFNNINEAPHLLLIIGYQQNQILKEQENMKKDLTASGYGHLLRRTDAKMPNYH